MKGNIIVLEQGEGIFEGNLGLLGIKGDGKLRKRTIKAVLPDTSKRQIVLECRSYRPDLLTVCIRPDKDNLIMFEFANLKKNGKYKNIQGKDHSSGQGTPWICSFKMK